MTAALISIAEYSVVLFTGVFFVAQFACYEAGFRLAARRRGHPAAQPEAVGVVVGGMLGLLAFVLALTLSFANARFSERQAGSLAEANAIGTAWLRAKAIGDPRGEAIAGLLEQYIAVRADFVEAGRDDAVINRLNQTTGALQSQMWGHLAGIVRERPDPVVAELMSALNATFDASTSERFAFQLRLPTQMFWLLVGMTLLSMACLGYQFGLRGRPMRLLVALLTFMWAAVIVNILDLASARLGQFRTGTAAYEWTRQGFRGGVVIPPLPSP
ncbi:bestrophin-like domain [Ancylobacter terrae]|uniref:bestrophin-like domain n=1 Tax=Ancylobacter sp. sgz301288 TaxID=3342077 RepID=UPI00385912BB